MHSKRGFTLIEMLIAVVILGVVAGLMYGVLHSGLRAYERGISEVSAEQDVYGFFTLLRSDISQMLESDKDTVKTDRISLIVPDTDEKKMKKITYLFAGDNVSRQISPLPEDKNGKNSSETVLYGVQSVEMVGMADGKWMDDKDNKTDKLPQAVRLKVVLNETGKTYEGIFSLAYRSRLKKK